MEGAFVERFDTSASLWAVQREQAQETASLSDLDYYLMRLPVIVPDGYPPLPDFRSVDDDTVKLRPCAFQANVEPSSAEEVIRDINAAFHLWRHHGPERQEFLFADAGHAVDQRGDQRGG